MAASDEWTDWHLTPSGWERGSEKEDFNSTERPTPLDRVCTYRWREYLSSTFSTMDRKLELLWETDDKSALQSLKQKFGDAPKNL